MARLLAWLKARAERTADELRRAGWTEDSQGLWSLGTHRGLHLLDAASVAREGP
jgi:hypothetical protein